ncbi:hypothetical protein, partial [Enterobacter kobei]|uniref:hypothetical protein n=1 Tax=Enterobacter kobei TaxID=208224 RepID=UPI001EDCDF77
MAEVGVKQRVTKLEGATQSLAVGHGWGKKLAQKNSKPHKAVIRLALTLCFLPAYFLHTHAFIFCTFKSWIS